jgi:hypothetical protein
MENFRQYKVLITGPFTLNYNTLKIVLSAKRIASLIREEMVMNHQLALY